MKKRPKDQLKVLIDRDVHRKLRALCEKERRTPAGEIEFLVIKEMAETGQRG
jgi:hypothetical protein